MGPELKPEFCAPEALSAFADRVSVKILFQKIAIHVKNIST